MYTNFPLYFLHAEDRKTAFPCSKMKAEEHEIDKGICANKGGISDEEKMVCSALFPADAAAPGQPRPRHLLPGQRHSQSGHRGGPAGHHQLLYQGWGDRRSGHRRAVRPQRPPRSRSTTSCSTPTRTAPATTAPIPDGSTSSRTPKRSASSARRFPTAARRLPPATPPSPATTSATTSPNFRWKFTAANRSAPTTPCTGWTTT